MCQHLKACISSPLKVIHSSVIPCPLSSASHLSPTALFHHFLTKCAHYLHWYSQPLIILSPRVDELLCLHFLPNLKKSQILFLLPLIPLPACSPTVSTEANLQPKQGHKYLLFLLLLVVAKGFSRSQMERAAEVMEHLLRGFSTKCCAAPYTLSSATISLTVVDGCSALLSDHDIYL